MAAHEDRLFEAILGELQQLIVKMEDDGLTQAAIAKRLGVSQSNVSMMKSGQRGQGVRLSTAIRAFRAEGGDMVRLLEGVLGQQEAAAFLGVAEEDPEGFEALVYVLSRGGKTKQKILEDAKFYKDQWESD